MADNLGSQAAAFLAQVGAVDLVDQGDGEFPFASEIEVQQLDPAHLVLVAGDSPVFAFEVLSQRRLA